ncbi:MAG: hypothetical protein NVS4B13_10200 [Candidatus Elarobacter sp.]
MKASSSAAQHLAETDAGYDAHLAALRQHAEQVRAVFATDAAELAERLEPDLEFDPEPQPRP